MRDTLAVVRAALRRGAAAWGAAVEFRARSMTAPTQQETQAPVDPLKGDYLNVLLLFVLYMLQVLVSSSI